MEALRTLFQSTPDLNIIATCCDWIADRLYRTVKKANELVDVQMNENGNSSNSNTSQNQIQQLEKEIDELKTIDMSDPDFREKVVSRE